MACLTRENVQQILQKYSNKEYDIDFSYSLKPSERHNILKMKLSPEVAQNRPQFFVKTLGYNPVPSDLVTTNDYSNKEVNFYKYINNICEKHGLDGSTIPYIYFADPTINTLVLEDLCKLGYKKCPTNEYDANHMEVAISSLAKFHSLSIIHDENRKGNRDMNIFPSAIGESFYGNISDDSLKLLTRYLAQEVKSDDEYYQDKLFTEYKKMLQDFITDEPERNVCCHGDLFFDNILFQYQENEIPVNCKFVDFGFARYKPPAHDLTMLLYSSISSKLRQAKYNYFLKYYYQQLQKELEQNQLDIKHVLPLYEFELSCKKYMRFTRMTVALYKIIHNSCQESKEQCKNVSRKYTIKPDLTTHIDNTILSKEDVHTIIRKKIKTADYDLQAYKLQPLAVKSGFLGEHMYLSVDILVSRGVTQTLQYFVKSLPQLESQRNFAIETGGIFKETSWFRKMMPDYLEHGIDIIQKCTPICYLARDNDVFVFEDLKESGFDIISARTPLDIDGIKRAISCLAKYHAAPLILEEVKSRKLGRKYRLIEDYAKEFEETFYSDNEQSVNLINAVRVSTPVYVDLLPIPTNSLVSREEIIAAERKLVGEFSDDVIPSNVFRNSVCHGDLWNGNIMFKQENGVVSEAILIDFQSYRYGPPAQDLLAMIYLTTDRALRKRHMGSLTRHYYEELGMSMAKYDLDIKHIISAKEFRTSLDHYEKFAITQATTHLQIVTMSPEAMKQFFDDKDMCNKCLFIDRSDHIIKCCDEDPVYRRVQEETLLDLIDLCEKMKKMGQI